MVMVNAGAMLLRPSFPRRFSRIRANDCLAADRTEPALLLIELLVTSKRNPVHALQICLGLSYATHNGLPTCRLVFALPLTRARRMIRFEARTELYSWNLSIT